MDNGLVVREEIKEKTGRKVEKGEAKEWKNKEKTEGEKGTRGRSTGPPHHGSNYHWR